MATSSGAPPREPPRITGRGAIARCGGASRKRPTRESYRYSMHARCSPRARARARRTGVSFARQSPAAFPPPPHWSPLKGDQVLYAIAEPPGVERGGCSRAQARSLAGARGRAAGQSSGQGKLLSWAVLASVARYGGSRPLAARVRTTTSSNVELSCYHGCSTRGHRHPYPWGGRLVHSHHAQCNV